MHAEVKRRLIRLLAVLMVAAAALTCGPAAAERLRIIPVPPNVTAQWTPLPDLPRVSYAPNIPTDVFKHRGRYYFFWEGVWYQSKKIKGPWMRQDHPPAILSRIQTAYFKTLPKAAAQPPAAGAPSLPPGGGMVTPEGTPMAPPVAEPPAPVPPAPPSEAVAPPPEAVTPPHPPEGEAPLEPAAPAAPESQESAPLAVPEGEMPKAM
ncbi:MAG: hypothetical protein C4567_12535 [Deltaproteobacteria bacterium]|nr:MAG: hypothetical protein C4567_12535 [Deltaproteobacteria bacterium]